MNNCVALPLKDKYTCDERNNMATKQTSKTLVRLSAAVWLENMEWIAQVMSKENRNKSDALRLILRRDEERESK